jgi:hypothetical protein
MSPLSDLYERYECPSCKGTFPYNQFTLTSPDVWGVSPMDDTATRYNLGNVYKHELCGRRVWVRQRSQPPASRDTDLSFNPSL